MSAPTFGQLLGDLVRQKRRAKGLTQMQLAEDAFETVGKTRRISELESGSVANPHPKTIDPIITALGITEAEIEKCAKASAAQMDPDLDRAYREARNLIEAIARQFENDDPGASLAKLDHFLRAKAAEWITLRNRIESIEADERKISGLKHKANQALSNGNFDDVDFFLSEAEELHQRDRTLVEVKKQALIRISRGNNALLSGRSDVALTIYKSAVDFFRPFDESEMLSVADNLAYEMYEVSKRSLQPVFFIAASLLEMTLSATAIAQDPLRRADIYYRLGLI